tara:strand:- start:8 stop:1054 length:1047 start_codon:yes stop_codon:yes gene_type:complete
MKKILITGSAGFIGYHLTNELNKNYKIVGIDNLNEYYDINLKIDRLKDLGFKIDNKKNLIFKNEKFENLIFEKIDLTDLNSLKKLFEFHNFDFVVNLAAQAGVRYSIDFPQTYIDSNITGFLNILECCKLYKVKHLLYASSSSVYGLNNEFPFSEKHPVSHPISLYAATKRSNELMAHTYSHLFNLRTTGLRFFTVYGPWGRPDMALFKFTKSILSEDIIDVYNNGQMTRDFTYVKDIVISISKLIESKKSNITNKNQINENKFSCPNEIFNIASNSPIELNEFIKIIETTLGRKAKINFKPLQPGDVPDTYANVNQLINKINFSPKTTVNQGVKNFIDWYYEYYGKK